MVQFISHLTLLCIISAVFAYKAGDVVCTAEKANIRDAPCGTEGGVIIPGVLFAVTGGPVYQCCLGGCYNWTQVTNPGQKGWMTEFGLKSCKTLSEMVNFVASICPLRSPSTDISITVKNFKTNERVSYRGAEKHVSASSAKAIWTAAALHYVGIDPVTPFAGPIFKNSDNDATGKVIDLLSSPNLLNTFYFTLAAMNNSGFTQWNYGKKRVATNSPRAMGDDNYFTTDDAVNFLELLEQGKVIPGQKAEKLREWMTWSPRRGMGGWLGTELPAVAQQTMQHKAGWLPPGSTSDDHKYNTCNEIGYVNANGSRYAIALLTRRGQDYWNKQVPYLQYVSCMIYSRIADQVLDC